MKTKRRRLPATLLALPAALLLLLALPASSRTATALPQQTVDRAERSSELIERGRALLQEHKPEAALTLFEEASKLQPTPWTRLWELRAWMDLGRSNDTLDAIDTLRRSGERGIELEYLYGMAFARRARSLVLSDVADSSVRMNFIDAQKLLTRVVGVAAERFPDAYLSLARAAYSNRDLETARFAAMGAVRVFPEDGDAWLALGRVAIAQFAAVKGASEDELDEKDAQRADEHWRAAEDALRRAIEVLGIPSDARREELLARAATELGHALVWRERLEEAADSYARAIAFAPDGMNYDQLRRLLTPAPGDPSAGGLGGDGAPRPEIEREPPSLFLRAVEAGALAFQARNGLEDERDGELLWWLGWARYDAGRFVASEKALIRSIEKLPDSANTRFYLALARYARGDWRGASRALVEGWEVDPPAIVREMQTERDLNVAKVDWLVAQVDPESWMERATLAEICAETALDNPRLWNNLGLFLRSEAERLRNEGRALDDPEVVRLAERSLKAYERALGLAPSDPQLLNDTAVVLHYDLGRDLDRALLMYERGARFASKELERTDLTPTDRERFEMALRDATNNQKILREKLDLAPPE